MFALFCQQERSKNGFIYILIKKFTFYGKKRFIYGKNSCRNFVKGRSYALKLRKKVIKTMTYTSAKRFYDPKAIKRNPNPAKIAELILRLPIKGKRKAGASMSELVDATGLSPQRIRRIISEMRNSYCLNPNKWTVTNEGNKKEYGSDLSIRYSYSFYD